ncbi:hypothetical protein F441_06464 [Phytophthora nicotianae CJ01A1]|uniref:Uncharacterized protein n=6 Tax=Phytophthora nicotianae TaxID=4792 RepID=W2RDF4_PHYN3|nr:hypothetical protein PPTG_02567 [Phytophthora nicotianae INRA-310]ETI49850.1 hypothetical protein F443_06459 [Phytophthora nicotianae P1569]ETK89740.1 hypothetical protein L915_06336 [Phytophthora nicotianae]ETO78582.1 hypothetical protein F444_06519 [Phytophthora nicotianae P1976]ETP19618.1 hypothetical protein F441_06464 [Phytophthora nicotianae CJ01A1]ETP47562.1 hypothetical protein F442_06501 [Phytophthora nicotianae P10297]
MSESKHQEDSLRSRPTVDVTAVDISPNPAALTDELNLEVDFHLDVPVTNGVWDIEYLVDSVTKRHIIKLGQVEATNYARGDNHFQFSTSQINISGIQPSQLTNCGLLIAAFKGESGDILDLKMVIQVSEQRGGLQRIIYSPLE